MHHNYHIISNVASCVVLICNSMANKKKNARHRTDYLSVCTDATTATTTTTAKHITTLFCFLFWWKTPSLFCILYMDVDCLLRRPRLLPFAFVWGIMLLCKPRWERRNVQEKKFTNAKCMVSTARHIAAKCRCHDDVPIQNAIHWEPEEHF